MTTPSGQITANNVNDELGKLTIPLTAGTIDRTNEYIKVSGDYIGYGNRVSNGDVITYFANGGFGVISGLSNNAQYYIKNANNTHTQLAVGAESNPAVNLNSSGYTAGYHWFTRTSAPFSMNSERVRRLAGVTSGPISFSNLRSKSINKTYDSGFTTNSRQRVQDFVVQEAWSKYANGMYEIASFIDPAYGGGFNAYALDYYVFDTSAYANASIQSANLTLTVRLSWYNMDEGDTYFGILPFIRSTTYNNTPEPNFVTVTDYGNQNPNPFLSAATNRSTSGAYTTGDLVVSYPLQTVVPYFGADGGWSYGSTGQWNTSKIANPNHAFVVSARIGQYYDTNIGYGVLRVHSAKISGGYTL